MSNLFFVYITAPNTKVAEELAQRAVSEKLAACANFWPGMTSIYHWEGKIDKAEETVLILKTSEEKLAQLTEKVSEWHPYDVPCVLSLPLSGGNPSYIKWLNDNLK